MSEGNAIKSLPRKPTPEMIAAIEAHFRKWQKIRRRSDSWFKAQCWDALQAYYRLWDAAPPIDTVRDK